MNHAALNLANALGDAGQLDNVEDLLAEVTTSPRFDADVFTVSEMTIEPREYSTGMTDQVWKNPSMFPCVSW